MPAKSASKKAAKKSVAKAATTASSIRVRAMKAPRAETPSTTQRASKRKATAAHKSGPKKKGGSRHRSANPEPEPFEQLVDTARAAAADAINAAAGVSQAVRLNVENVIGELAKNHRWRPW
jgi:hypothetical protein